jgi:hypothetical protein
MLVEGADKTVRSGSFATEHLIYDVLHLHLDEGVTTGVQIQLLELKLLPNKILGAGLSSSHHILEVIQDYFLLFAHAHG